MRFGLQVKLNLVVDVDADVDADVVSDKGKQTVNMGEN